VRNRPGATKLNDVINFYFFVFFGRRTSHSSNILSSTPSAMLSSGLRALPAGC